MNTKKMFIVLFIFKFIPPMRGHNIKTRLLKWAGVQVGKNVEIASSAKILGCMNLIIGNNCYIGHDALIFGSRDSTITIEDYSKIGSRVVLVTGYHRFSTDGNCIEKEGLHKDVTIKTGAAISTASIILPGVTVGKMAHVAAGAVVTKDVCDYTRVGGVPAKFMRDMRNLKDN